MKKLIIIGAGGHGKVIADIASGTDYDEIFFLDDTKKFIDEYKVLGCINDFIKFKAEEYEFIVAIGNNDVREKIQRDLKLRDYKLAVLIHPSAVVSPSADIKEGSVVMANCVINAGSVIGNGCIINTASTIDHDCVIQDYVHISPGVHIAGTVKIEKKTWIGVGSSVMNNIAICKDCIIGAGSVVIKDICNSGTYVGIPAKQIK